MDTRAAVDMARGLLAQHGLAHLPVELTRSRRALGVCKFMRGQPYMIGLSQSFVQLNGEDEVRDTILHEIAHALAGRQAGHGWAWQAQARRIGARPQRCATGAQVVAPAAPWALVCPACGSSRPVYRRTRPKPWQRKACGHCCRKHNHGAFDQRFALEYRSAKIPLDSVTESA